MLRRHGLRAVIGAAAVFGMVLVSAGAAARPAFGADLNLEITRVPEHLRSHPAAPELSQAPSGGNEAMSRGALSPLAAPDYGPTAPPGTQLRVELNADADEAGSEISGKADALAPNDPAAQDWMKRCMAGALWDLMFDAIWDAINGHAFNLGAEFSTTANRAAACMANHLGVGPLVAKSISDWMIESVVEHGSDVVARDPSLSAFVNWVGVTAWYSL